MADIRPLLRVLLARGVFFPAARELARLMLAIADRRAEVRR